MQRLGKSRCSGESGRSGEGGRSVRFKTVNHAFRSLEFEASHFNKV